jgi:hypothetical protein
MLHVLVPNSLILDPSKPLQVRDSFVDNLQRRIIQTLDLLLDLVQPHLFPIKRGRPPTRGGCFPTQSQWLRVSSWSDYVDVSCLLSCAYWHEQIEMREVDGRWLVVVS